MDTKRLKQFNVGFHTIIQLMRSINSCIGNKILLWYYNKVLCSLNLSCDSTIVVLSWKVAWNKGREWFVILKASSQWEISKKEAR